MYERQVLFRKQHIPSLVMKALLFVAAFLLCLLLTTQEASAEVYTIAEGTAGDVTWTIKTDDVGYYTQNCNATLTFSGNGGLYRSSNDKAFNVYAPGTRDEYGVVSASPSRYNLGWDESGYNKVYLNVYVNKIVIEEGITTIGANAFHCGDGYDFLWMGKDISLSLPSTLTSIGAGAFRDFDGATKIIIPESVTDIGSNAFDDADSPIRGGGEIKSIGSYAFNSSGVTSLSVASNATIGNYAFSDSELSSFVWPSETTGIGTGTFQRSKIQSIIVPRNVSSVGTDAFADLPSGSVIYTYNKSLFVTGSNYTSPNTVIKGIYNVRFTNHDGTTLKTQEVYEGNLATAPTASPTKGSDNEYTYTFSGWSPAVTAVSADTVHVAQYNALPRSYSVVFKDYDDRVISSTAYNYNNTVTVPADPIRESDDMYDYAFAGWGGTVATTCTGDATYTATYTSNLRNYTVEFWDWDDSVLDTKTDYHWGDTVTPPTDPTRPQTQESTYTFAGWEPNIVAVNGNAFYKATYTATGQQYTIRFLDWDGTVLDEQKCYYGDAVEIPAAPSREADERYNYYFNGWDYAVTDVTRNKTYTATYTAIPKSFTVMFKNWDGELLFLNASYQYGDTVYEPTVTNTPPSDNDKLYINVFSGWSPEFNGTCQGNAVHVAQFEKDYIEYPVVFKNWDGTVISSVDYHYGDTVTTPADPFRETDNTYAYVFAGWDKEVATTCTEAATYVAQYEAAYREFTVTFQDYDGAELSKKSNYHYGDSVVVPASPTRGATDQITYSFSGWSPNIQATVTGDVVYTATYDENATEHTVKFLDWDAYVISSDTYVWGDIVTVPDNPYRVGDDTYIYEFTGWSPEVVTTVSGSVLYVAQYQSTYKDYVVTFLDEDGTEISSSVYHWGDTIAVPANPIKAQDGETVYTFAGWDSEVAATCQGSVTYTATYNSGVAHYTVTFRDWNGEPLFVRADYVAGETVELPIDPVRANDSNYAYTFAGWTPTVASTVTGNATYTATYTVTSTSEFEVMFVDYDGTVISTATYEEGETVIFPDDPARPDDVDNNISFAFAGWNCVVGADGDLTYIATYSMSYIGTYAAYTVIFEDYDGTELEVATYEQPEDVVTPASPTRESDNVYNYHFSGWVYEGGNEVSPMAMFSMRALGADDDSDPAASFVAVYAANYLETYRKYAVTFQDWNGTVLSSKMDYHWGDTVEVPADPTRESDGRNTYTFAGWDKVVNTVDGNAAYVATYTATPIQQESGSSSGYIGGWWDDSYGDTDTEDTPAEEPPIEETPAESEPEGSTGEIVEQPTGGAVNGEKKPVNESKPSVSGTVEETPVEDEDVTITYYDYYGVAHTHVIKDGETKLVPSDVPERIVEDGRTYEFKKWEISLDENGNRVYKPVYALVETEEAPLDNTPVTIDPGASGAEGNADGEGDLSAVQIVAIVAASIVAVVGISAGVSFLHRRRN